MDTHTLECGSVISITCAKQHELGMRKVLALWAEQAVVDLMDQFDELENQGQPFTSFSLVVRAHSPNPIPK